MIKEHERNGAIDGLRAIACLAVISHHCVIHAGDYDWPTLKVGPAAIHVSKILEKGYIGVELFFVISGFCLARQLLCLEKIDWKDYLIRRGVRITPPYLVVFGCLAVCSWLFQGIIGWKNILYGIPLVAGPFNPSFWTLVVEMRWYLLLPFLIGLYRRWGGFVVGTAALGSCIGYKLAADSGSGWWPRVNFVISAAFLYLPTFCTGIFLASAEMNDGIARLFSGVFRSWIIGVLLTIVFICLLLVPDVHDGFQSWHRLIAGTVGAAALILVALGNQKIGMLLSSPGLQLVGRASYSVYLIHEPLVRLCFRVVGGSLATGRELFVLFQFVVLPSVVAIGIMFHLYVEKPLVAKVKRWVDVRAVPDVQLPVVGGE